MHPLAGIGERPRQKLVRGVVGGDQHPMAERREALGQISETAGLMAIRGSGSIYVPEA